MKLVATLTVICLTSCGVEDHDYDSCTTLAAETCDLACMCGNGECRIVQEFDGVATGEFSWETAGECIDAMRDAWDCRRVWRVVVPECQEEIDEARCESGRVELSACSPAAYARQGDVE